jgi:hypothetical protein
MARVLSPRGLPLLLLLLLTLVSCATITTGTHESIAVSSSPPGAHATLTCERGEEHHGVTPLAISIRRNSGNCKLRVSKEGFREESIAIEQRFNKAYLGNFAASAPFVLYGFIGLNGTVFTQANSETRAWGTACLLSAAAVFAVDHWTGAIHKHIPRTVDVVLKPKE